MWWKTIAAALLALLFVAALWSCNDAEGVAMDPNGDYDSGPPDGGTDSDSDSDSDSDTDTN